MVFASCLYLARMHIFPRFIFHHPPSLAPFLAFLRKGRTLADFERALRAAQGGVFATFHNPQLRNSLRDSISGSPPLRP